ncbi:MAG TPA: aminotransferase class I/II-fold pyridoxal phosphate-dependent enzyme [Polyangiaceae bacterium]
MDPAYEARLEARCEALASICVHAGEEPNAYRALATPIVLASAFEFDSAEHAASAFRGENAAFIYGRWGNPTVLALEAKLAALEGGPAACATASGMAAVSGTLLSICEAGAHVVAPRSMYGESARLLRERLPRLGIETTFVDDPTPEAYARAATPKTRVFYIESPSNPTLAVADLPGIVAAARRAGAKTIADNTFATPFCQTPLALGVDLVVHSMTKALGGHGDAIGGAVVGGEEDVARARDTIVKGFGGVMSPLGAYLVARGMVTFALRQRRACSTAAHLASVLASHPAIARVHHPSLAPERAKHMHAFGSLLSFELAGPNSIERGRTVLETVKLATHAVSLGDARTLVTQPATTTHASMPADAREKAGITGGLLRLSVGLESREDLERDLLAALEVRP